MKLIINYDVSTKEFNLYSSDLDLLLKSDELFKVLVMFNTYLTEKYGDEFNILKSDDIEYILDSRSMKQMILSNVQLLKKLSRMPSAFQLSSERFGGSSSSTMLKSKPNTEGFDNMMKNKKAFKSSKFK